MNARGERNKEKEIEQVIKETETDLCLVTEAHELEGVKPKGVMGYKRLGKARRMTERKWDRVAIYVRRPVIDL